MGSTKSRVRITNWKQLIYLTNMYWLFVYSLFVMMLGDQDSVIYDKSLTFQKVLGSGQTVGPVLLWRLNFFIKSE